LVVPIRNVNIHPPVENSMISINVKGTAVNGNIITAVLKTLSVIIIQLPF